MAMPAAAAGKPPPPRLLSLSTLSIPCRYIFLAIISLSQFKVRKGGHLQRRVLPAAPLAAAAARGAWRVLSGHPPTHTAHTLHCTC